MVLFSVVGGGFSLIEIEYYFNILHAHIWFFSAKNKKKMGRERKNKIK